MKEAYGHSSTYSDEIREIAYQFKRIADALEGQNK